MEEMWKQMVGYPNYKISNMGHVKSRAKNGSYRDISLGHNHHGYLTFGPSKYAKDNKGHYIKLKGTMEFA